MKDGKVGIGIVGARFAAELHSTAYSRCPDARLVAVCSNRPGEAEEFAAKFDIERTYSDYRDMLLDPDVDLVSICVPTSSLRSAMACCGLESRSSARNPGHHR